MKRLLQLLALFALGACGTANLAFDTMRPADITLPDHIVSVGVINRSLPAEDKMLGNVLEGVLTGEGIGNDRKGSQYCTESLVNFLQDSPRLEAGLINDPEVKGTGTDEFSLPLPWGKVEELCRNYGVDAIIVLESFDSDAVRVVSSPIKSVKTVEGRKVTVIEYKATLRLNIRSGWRIYDVKRKKIIDENVYNDEKIFTEKDVSEQGALGKLPSAREAVKAAGVHAGRGMGYRVSPMWVTVNRKYYTNKHDDFKEAKKLVKAGRIDDAIDKWAALAKVQDPEIASRAAYNMALANEYKGNLQLALNWAEKSKSLGMKEAHNYMLILNRRMIDEERLQEQLINQE